MTENLETNEENLVSETEFEGLSGIFIAEYQISNMKLERIVVSDPAIVAILKVTKLSQQAQEEAVIALVERTPDWLDFEPDLQIERIKAVLTQETVLEYLKHEGVIRRGCDMVETGIDQEGSIVIEAYYTELNREQRRAIDKSMTDEQKERMAESLNILSGQDNLIDLAAEKLKRLKDEQPKVRKVAQPKRKK